MVTDGNHTYCGEHFKLYINVKSLFDTPKINIMLHDNYT